MGIKLEVTWSNPASPLLADPAVAVMSLEYPPGDPPPAPPQVARLKAGVYGIEIPGEPVSFELSVGFHFAMPGATILQREWRGKPPRVVLGQTSAPIVSSRLALAKQKYQVRGGMLLPLADAPRFGASGHPLFAPPGVRRPDGTLPIRVFTDFVNATDLWMNRATDSERYSELHQPGTQLVALGFTAAGGPLLWFAVVPEICRTAASVSCLVFFRPTGHYSYSSVDQPHDMYPLNRYLIAPRTAKEVAAEPWTFERFFAYIPANSTDGRPIWYRDLCVGMEAALANSRKKAVILIPWPSGPNYGISAQSDLREISRQVFRLLHAEGLVGKGQSQVSLNRLGIAGFSSGGGQMMLALSHNRKDVRELYAFDCQGMKAFKGQVVDWARGSENRLRMTGGYDETILANTQIHDELTGKHGKPADRVSVYPRDATASWELSKNLWWDYVRFSGLLVPEEEEKLRTSKDIRHQFAMFGGNDPSRKVSFLAEFLKQSDL